mmetsp:Transcript_69668/g.167223  ORF Transcript_69668/g.167223 Transcript_69668/m.167223 type:complete len:241 (-) Transcript_69668:153-875(-)
MPPKAAYRDNGSFDGASVAAELVQLSSEVSIDGLLGVLVDLGEEFNLSRGAELLRLDLRLCMAAGRGDLQEVAVTLQQGAEVNCAPSFGGMTPLMFASRFGHLNIADYLLTQQGIAAHATTAVGETALSLCPSPSFRLSLVHALVERCGDTGQYAAIQAACLGHTAVLQCLLQQQVDPNTRDDKGRPVLLVGGMRRNLDVCELLLSYGADPNLVDPNGCQVWTVADDALRTVLALYSTPH